MRSEVPGYPAVADPKPGEDNNSETSKERPQRGTGSLVFVERLVSSRKFALYDNN